MNLRLNLLAATAVATLAVLAPAQGTVRTVGGGCPGKEAPTATGPLTTGSLMSVQTGCISSPNTSKFLLVGVALPTTSWVGLRLQTSLAGYSLCDVSVYPVIVSADVTAAPDPLPILISNDPIWVGFQLGLQSYCVECGFAGCFPTLTPGIEVTIG